MQIVKTKSECDHVQFLITDTSGPGVVSNPMITELETLSVGEWHNITERAFYFLFRKRKVDITYVTSLDDRTISRNVSCNTKI